MSAQVVYRCAFRVVWCTQYRAPVLEGPITERLREIAAEVIADNDSTLVELNLKPSCLNLVVEVPPQFGIHRLVKAVKARTARVLRTEFPTLRSRLPSLWTNAYFVTTVGDEIDPRTIEGYIKRQLKR